MVPGLSPGRPTIYFFLAQLMAEQKKCRSVAYGEAEHPTTMAEWCACTFLLAPFGMVGLLWRGKHYLPAESTALSGLGTRRTNG